MRVNDFKLEVFFDEHEFSTPYLLAQSDCQSRTVAELLSLEPGSEARLADTRLGYTEAAGSEELRSSVAALYRGMGSHNVLTHCGAEEAIFAYLNVVLSAGDEVIVLTPTYQSLSEIPRAIGAKPVPWRLRNRIGEQNGQAASGAIGAWYADFDELETLISPLTRLIIVNTPNNPTGYTLTADEIDKLVAIAARHNLAILADEVYRGLTLDGLARPALVEVYDKAVSLGVMSKAYGLAGLRIGWLVGADTALLARVQKYKHYLSICNSVTSEFLAGIALRNGERIIADNVDIISGNVALAERFFVRHGDKFINNPPQSGSVAFHRLTDAYAAEMADALQAGLDGRAAADSTQPYSLIELYCRYLAKAAGVLLLPGSTYDVNEPYFRMGYGRADFADALAVLDRFLSNGSVE
ncbi:MAG TPA: aspartate/tyrosine/aromatic aminotransferase [Coriobacteriia bacterium]|nr:aspartate/tyrosine/aromatic aminotransferase [Coriobacteriia bacterium]